MWVHASRKSGSYLGIFAFFAANLILVLTLSGQSPDLHALLHSSQENEVPCSEEACVIDLFSGGQILGADPVVIPVPAIRAMEVLFPSAMACNHYLTDYLLVPGRSPPSVSIYL
ncbi:MAG: hypothetical protein WD490_00050 [Opitutales bacterium]